MAKKKKETKVQSSAELHALVFGDVHGDFSSWASFLSDLQKSDEIRPFDTIFQLGDFGWWYDSIKEHSSSLRWIFNNFKVYFVRGNHEEYTRYNMPFFSEFDSRIVGKYFSDVKYKPVQMKENKIELGGVIFQGIGGADSWDKGWRVEKDKYADDGLKSWFPEERVDLTGVDMSAGVDIVMTHNIPDNVYTLASDLLQSTDKSGDETLTRYYCKCPPRFWLAGHHHVYDNFIDKRSGTEFFVLPESNFGFIRLDIINSEISLEAFNLW